MRHYNEVELLENYYLSGGSAEIANHLAACAECSSRYSRLREKLSCSALDHQKAVEGKPEFFWSRQRGAISRRLSSPQRAFRLPVWRLAVAASLALVLGLILVVGVKKDSEPQVAQSTPIAAEPAATGLEVPSDPWESDQLQSYAEVVEWESWLEEGTS